MKKLVGFLVLVLLLVGCAPSSVLLPEKPPAEVVPPKIVFPKEPPEDATWISPGKVVVEGFYPGARVEEPVKVHNGNNIPTSFEIKFRLPDHVGEGYVKAPVEVEDWITVEEQIVILGEGETRDILVILAMPEDIQDFPDKWEFWIAVKAVKQTGMVQTELAVRWLVGMK